MTHDCQAFIYTWLNVLQMQEAVMLPHQETKWLKHQVSSYQLHPNIDHFNKF